MEYTIEAVASEVREYESKYGTMKSYKLKLTGELDPVELSQKATTPAPTVGTVLNGNIEDGQYGKKFKKDFQANGTTPRSFGGGAPKDSYTMYLSYAKDILIAMLESKAGFDEAQYGVLLSAVSNGGDTLYEARPDAKVESKPIEVKPVDSPDPKMPEDWLL